MTEKICCICKKDYSVFKGVGNNAFPIKNGECCDECNYKLVFPKRIELIIQGGKKNV